jgi:thioredoxin-like negative regulator of GroEL
VLFFSRNDKSLTEVFTNVANKAIGLFKVAAVSCEEDEEICEEFNVDKYPMVLYFSDNSNDSEEAYKGKKTVDDIFAFAAKNMQNFVKRVDSKNAEKILNFRSPHHKIILFTSKNETPALFKVLSKAFRENLIFLEIQDTQKELISKFRITRFPTILALTDSDNYIGDIYRGHFKRKDIEGFFNKYSNLKIEKIRELTEQLFKQNNCNHNDAKNICVLYLNKSSTLNSKSKKFLEELSQKYINDPFRFFYVNLTKYKHFISSFEDLGFCEFVVIKGKRKQYKTYCGEVEGLSNFLDDIAGGVGNFKLLNNSLFAPPNRKSDL